jgi:type IV secretory pathway VirB10-like protein
MADDVRPPLQGLFDPQPNGNTAPEDFAIRQAPARTARFSRRMVWIVVALAAGIGGFLLARASRPVVTKPVEAPREVMAPLPPPGLAQLPKDYSAIPQPEEAVPPPVPPPPDPGIPVAVPAPTPPPAPKPVPVAAPARTTTTAQQPKPPHRGILAKRENAGGPVFPLPKEPQERRERESRGASLIQPANWARLERPEYGLYRDMVIPGLMFEGINSDTPGQVKVMITVPIMDKQTQRIELIPQFANAILMPKGEVKYGQQRLEVTLEQFIFPDRTVLGLGKGQVGEVDGTPGLRAEVDNHYVQLGIAAILSAALGIGPRIAAGSQQGFAPTLPQEFANQAATSFNQAGQDIIKRELLRKPTLTREGGTPVTIQLLENISLQQPPTRITK